MTAPGKNTETYKNMKPLIDLLPRVKFISIDPSIGSSSSMPAYAIYSQGELIYSAKLRIDPTKSTYKKAQEISRQLSQVYEKYKPQVLIYEEIPDQGYAPGGKGINHKNPFATGHNARAHATLLKALGVILGIPGPNEAVGLRPMVWKKRARTSYKKGDIADAVEIGWVALEMAREIREIEDGAFPYREDVEEDSE